MAFITEHKRIVPGHGPATARIAIVGEAPGAYEDMALKPFVGPAGTVLEQCLHAANLIRGEVYLTNVVKVRPKSNDISPFYSSTKGTFTQEGLEWVAMLQDELNSHNANIIVACGATAFSALCGIRQVTRYRGYLFPSVGLARVRKVIPCIHPSAALRGMYHYRYLISADLKKAKLLSATADMDRPERQLVYEYASVEEALEWLAFYEKEKVVGADIEVINFELSCISFSSDPKVACVIPLHGWTEMEEVQLWRGIQRVLGNPHSVKVFQNGIFDIQFLLTRCGLEVKGPLHDTMIAHSIMFPELQKSLAFLGSIYCGSSPYWKDTVKFDNIKEES